MHTTKEWKNSIHQELSRRFPELFTEDQELSGADAVDRLSEWIAYTKPKAKPTPDQQADRIAVIQWREWGEDEDTLTITLATESDDVIQNLAVEYNLTQDEDGPGSIQVIGSEMIRNGQTFGYKGRFYRILIQPLKPCPNCGDGHAAAECSQEIQP